MGKPTGFLEYNREDDEDIPVKQRIKNFDEFHIHLSENERKIQGARCMNCGVPLCQSAVKLNGMVTGCPLHNLIPEWNDEIYRGDFKNALSRLLKTSNFPEFTGRVCPALCEKACINGMDSEPVTIHNNELFLIEKGFAEGYVKPRIPKVRSGKKVAVIGAGPSGLAVADQLNHRGHTVAVFERDSEIGGLLMYGIPNQKLEKDVILRRKKLMEEEGVVFTTDCDIKDKKLADKMLSEFDAIALCCGAKKARPLAAEGIDKAKGVYFAVDFLASTTKSLMKTGKDKTKASSGKTAADNYLTAGEYISAEGKNVVIVGGGDTGNDCVGTSIRHGAKSVVQIEMMPEPPVERQPNNPWPEWPKVKKTDYGQQEAIEIFGADPRIYETTIKSVKTDKNGNITSVETVKVKFANGKLEEVAGTEKELKCDLLIIAAGFLGSEEYVPKAFGIDLDNRNKTVTEAGHYKTNVDKVFTAGDMHRGQSLVVWAIEEGRECAAEIDEYLMGYTSLY